MGHNARADSGLCCADMMAVEKQIGLPGAKVPGTRVCHQKNVLVFPSAPCLHDLCSDTGLTLPLLCPAVSQGQSLGEGLV